MTRFTSRRGKAGAIAAMAALAFGALALGHAATTAGAATRAAGSTAVSLAGQAAATSYNGSVSSNGGDATVYDYPGSGTLDSSLASLGTLADGTQVTIQCYLTGTPVTGPNGQGPDNSDVYWDQVTGTSAGLPQVPAGDTAVVPDAYIQTTPTVDQLVPACGSSTGNSGAAAGAVGDGAAGSEGAASGAVGLP